MSKVSFRARQIDFNKPLPILKNGSDILSDLNENALVNRGVPHIPSGMEKEEENEHHFVEVIQALQLQKDAALKIPVPDVIDQSVYYQKVYPNSFSLPKRLVHFGAIFLAEEQPVDYDMDTEDEEWLSKSELPITSEKFESMIDTLERGCGQKVMNLEEAKYLLQDDHSLVIAVYDYWLHKRVQCRQPLLYSVRQERRDSSNSADPYVAFRRRSEKMQTRKNRKNDEQSYEKMLLLREQMESLGELLSHIVKREALKEAVMQSDHRCFETRCSLTDWDGSFLAEADAAARKAHRSSDAIDPLHAVKEPPRKRPSRKRKLSQRMCSAPEVQQTQKDKTAVNFEEDLQGPYVFIRTQGCRYLKPRALTSPITESPLSKRQQSSFQLTTIPSVCHMERHTYTGYIRRRLGRGGRVVCDRSQPSSHLAEYFALYDDHLQSSTNSTSSISESMHFSSRRFQPKDESLLHRLRSVILKTRNPKPTFQWPRCTESSFPPTFEPLHPYPWQINSVIRTPTPQPSPAETRLTDDSPSHPSNPHPRLSGSDSPPASKEKEVSTVDRIEPKSSESVTAGILATKKLQRGSMLPLTNSPQTVVPVSAGTLTSAPHRLWRKLARPYGGAIDALQPSDVPRSRGGETPICVPNGLSPRLLPTPDDRLLLSDTVLPSSKVCCMARDCVPRDTNVSGPQLQTANGVNATQFCQLPI